MGLRVALDERRVRDLRIGGALLGEFEHGSGEVDAGGPAAVADVCGRGEGGGTAPAADVEDAHSGPWVGGGEEGIRDGGEDFVALVGPSDPLVAAVAVPGLELCGVGDGHVGSARFSMRSRRVGSRSASSPIPSLRPTR